MMTPEQRRETERQAGVRPADWTDDRAISTKLWVWLKGPNALWGLLMIVAWAWIWR